MPKFIGLSKEEGDVASYGRFHVQGRLEATTTSLTKATAL